MKILLEDLECSMDGLGCSAVQTTKQRQYLKLDQNIYYWLELLFLDYILIKFYIEWLPFGSKICYDICLQTLPVLRSKQMKAIVFIICQISSQYAKFLQLGNSLNYFPV